MALPLPTSEDRWVEHPQGRLFACVWHPAVLAAQTPLLLFHDSLGSVELWRSFPQALCAATGRRVVAYDRLGFGRSDPRRGPLPPDFIADEARTFLPVLREQLDLTTFIAFGHSVGGAMAAECAAQWPEACRALVTESAQAFVEDRTLEGIRVAQKQFAAPGQLGRLERYHGSKARWVLEAWTGTWLAPAFAAWSLAPALPGVRCPLLVLHGTHDEYGSPRHPQRIAALSGGLAWMELLEGLHHVPHREDPARVLALVAEFLAPWTDTESG
ncbi:alpha/beta hydrolase [Deinococcus sp. SDU3-2]|uniref:Alpha/beta hydrolase n=1 Tax=Deinococcus terrestris TaxID=2651870 RepID=A0A7X1NYB8_9DEIO|nr:alpha/beta fold hydrolase [Deinococcus terrestris]MPY67656.1 alpha/beta hydrolase [Deinococcus terrestris]